MLGCPQSGIENAWKNATYKQRPHGSRQQEMKKRPKSSKNINKNVWVANFLRLKDTRMPIEENQVLDLLTY